MMRIAEIRIYPVKGLRGLSVAEARVEPWGLAGDRRFMVVTADDRFLTQREHPAMATLAVDLVPAGLVLSRQDLGRLEVAEPATDRESRTVTIWKNRVVAQDCGPKAAAWLSNALGLACRLVHMSDPASARPVDPDFGEAQDHVSFADGFPLLVTTTASLDDLNGRLDRPVGMDRFRTNLLVEGADAWAEDGWHDLAVGETRFSGVKDCARCAVTTVDQDTGVRSDANEPLRTLATFRRKAGGRIIFGQNLIPRRLGRIAVGDAVENLASASMI